MIGSAPSALQHAIPWSIVNVSPEHDFACGVQSASGGVTHDELASQGPRCLAFENNGWVGRRKGSFSDAPADSL